MALGGWFAGLPVVSALGERDGGDVARVDHRDPRAERMVITEGSVQKYVTSIFAKLGLPAGDADHRRVLSVLAYLQH